MNILKKNSWLSRALSPAKLLQANISLTPVTVKAGVINKVEKASTASHIRNKTLQKATFGAGCFWGVEADFRRIKGVVATAVGYEGGNYDNPSYQDVCSHTTNHAEVVEIDFDPAVVTYDELLEVFWSIHDPTTPNRQGLDFGSQYRSVIFCHNNEQLVRANASKEKLQTENRFHRPVTTQIIPATPFYRAEEYHQQYYEKTGYTGCHLG